MGKSCDFLCLLVNSIVQPLAVGCVLKEHIEELGFHFSMAVS